MFVDKMSSRESVRTANLGHLLFKKATCLVVLTVDVMSEAQSILFVTNTMVSVPANPRSREGDAMNLFKLITIQLCINTSMKLKMEEQSLILLLVLVTTKVSSLTIHGEDMPVLPTS